MAEILIVEDDLGLRTQIKKHLENKDHQVDTASDGTEGLQSVEQIGCDVLILDVRLPGRTGLEILQEMSHKLPFIPPTIIMTGHGDKESAIQAVRHGAFEFLEKPFDPEALDASIERALVERRDQIHSYRAFILNGKNNGLSPRELQVAHLAADGLSNDEVAKRLSLKSETVKTHLKNIFRKLGIPNRTALARKLKA